MTTLVFNTEKSLNAVLYIVSKLQRKDFHKVFKILYFADREHLILYGRPITSDKYIAMDDGPVPSNIYDIFKSVRGDGYFKDDGKFSQYFSVADWDLIVPEKAADLDELSRTDIECIDNSLQLYSNMSWREIREKSHDYAWTNTPQNREIELEYIIREAGGDDEFIEFVKENCLCANIITNV